MTRKTTKLERIIKARGVRKFRIAQSLDMSESTLSAWIANGLPRNVEKAAMLADLLKVPIEDLIEDATGNSEAKTEKGDDGSIGDGKS